MVIVYVTGVLAIISFAGAMRQWTVPLSGDRPHRGAPADPAPEPAAPFRPRSPCSARRVGVHLAATQVAAVLTALPAVATLIAAFRTKPAAVTAITGGLATIGTAATTFGLHWLASLIGADAPAASLVVALLLRMHVSPKTVVADVEQLATEVVASVQATSVPAAPVAAGPVPVQAVPSVAAPVAAPPPG